MSRAQPKLGQRVQVVTGNGSANGKYGKQLSGRVAYVGRTSFAGGQWFGVVLDEPRGKNNGSVQGSTYFKCAPNCGLFVRGQQLQLLLGAAEQEKQLLRKQNEQSNRNHDNVDNDNMQRDVSKVKLASRGRSRSSRQASEEQVSQTVAALLFAGNQILCFHARMCQGRPQHRPGEVQKSWQRRPRFH